MIVNKVNKKVVLLTLMLYSTLTFSCKKAGGVDSGGEEPKPSLSAIHSVIPLPQSVQFTEDEFVLDNSVKIVANAQSTAAVALLNKDLNSLAGITLSSGSASDAKTINISENSNLSAIAYEITINKGKIDIIGKDAVSVFYAIQTLRQYLWDARQDKAGKKITMKGVVIQDKPVYDWRVFQLDVARNFYTKDYVKKLIDWMALYKLNKLQLHLTDDQGWRIPIAKYPELIEQGSWRVFNEYDLENVERAKSNPIYTIDSRFLTTKDGEKIYKASYTKADLQEIVAYAAKNYIDVIPEIDMPGHMSAAIKAYPWLSATGGTGWGEEFSYPICPCKPNVKQFALDVLDELMDIFPSKYIHIGNDEVDKTTWESSAICQQYMADNGLNNVDQIQRQFISDLQAHLESKGRKAIVWDDAAEVGVNANA
ncbi:MAG: glycosyl hydrolase family 20, partial [Sphingobacteriaceae bacterium]